MQAFDCGDVIILYPVEWLVNDKYEYLSNSARNSDANRAMSTC